MKIRISVLTVLLLLLSQVLTAAPTVSNVYFSQVPSGEGGTIFRVQYDLTSTTPTCRVLLKVSLNGGESFSFSPSSATGDIGAGVTPGLVKTIFWDVAQDFPETIIADAKVRVIAEDDVPIPAVVSGSVVAGDTTPERAHTFSIVFSEAVTDFDSSDLQLLDAKLDSFVPVSPNTYTLEITATGPFVRVNFPAGAGAAGTGTGNETAGVSFEFIYLPPDFALPAAGSFLMGNSGVGIDLSSSRPNELPKHSVTLSPFIIGKYEITNAEYASALNWANSQGLISRDTFGTPYSGGGTVFLKNAAGIPEALIYLGDSACGIDHVGGIFVPAVRTTSFGLEDMAQHPVHNVTWFGAVAYCNFRSVEEGVPEAYDFANWNLRDANPILGGIQLNSGYRLPTEAEWEFAAAWDGTKHFVFGTWTDALIGASRANHRVDGGMYANPMGFTSGALTSRVGWFDGQNVSPNGSVQTEASPSPSGAYDMSGNVWEWCNDWYIDSYYADSPTVNPMGPTIALDKSIRGGSWGAITTSCRTALRINNLPSFRNDGIGMRIARGAQTP